jgi:hypothetical protein
MVSVLLDEGQSETPGAEPFSPESDSPDSHARSKTVERLRAAGLAGAAVVLEAIIVSFLIRASGLYVDRYYSEIFFLPGGALAGAISGLSKRRIVATLIGMGVAVFLYNFIPYYLRTRQLGLLITLATPTLGALGGLFIEKKMR